MNSSIPLEQATLQPTGWIARTTLFHKEKESDNARIMEVALSWMDDVTESIFGR